MPFLPAAQKLLFNNQKKTILLPAAGKRIRARSRFCCCKSFGIPPYCADPTVLIQFALFFGLPCAKTNDPALPTFTPLFSCLWLKRAPLWRTDLRKSASCPGKTPLFQFSPNGFPKSAPPWLQKYPVYLFRALFCPLDQC